MSDIYKKACQTMPPEDIDHHESDLYLRKTPASDRLIKDYENPSLVSTFRDQIDHVLWYEIPFAYTEKGN